jgi:hypothetical protein
MHGTRQARRHDAWLAALAAFVGKVQAELRDKGEPAEFDPMEAAVLRLGFRNYDDAAAVALEVLRLRRLRATARREREHHQARVGLLDLSTLATLDRGPSGAGAR